MIGLILFLHMTAVTVFVGIVIVSLFYVRSALKQTDAQIALRALKTTLLGDVLVLPCLIILFGTGLYLVCLNNLSIQVPWVFVALVTFLLASFFWLVNVFLKLNCYRALKKNKKVWRGFWLLYVLITVCMVLLFIMMIHDALTRSTVFSFLF